MSNTLTIGLSDTSKELGETTVNVNGVRIRCYNDAVQEFANERKWPFLIKENEALVTVVGENDIDISGIEDIRTPGGVKEIYLGSETTPYLPISWNERNNPLYANRKFFYESPDGQTLTLKGDVTQVLAVHLWYYYVPARIEDTSSTDTFPIPDRYRKTVATLSAAYVQWSRYLDAQGNRLFNVYERMVGKRANEQAEQNSGGPKKFRHYLQHIGFRRTYR